MMNSAISRIVHSVNGYLPQALTGQAFIKYDWEKQQPYRDRRGRCFCPFEFVFVSWQFV